jgi:hypothetical protein
MKGTSREPIWAPSKDRGLGADQDGQAAVITDAQSAGHDVQTVHAAGALTVVDLQLAVFQPHAFGRAEVDDFLLDVERAPVLAGVSAAIGLDFATDISGNGFLIDADVIAPVPMKDMSERAMEATQPFGQPSNLNLNFRGKQDDAVHPGIPGSSVAEFLAS